jgi:hypothetical protein
MDAFTGRQAAAATVPANYRPKRGFPAGDRCQIDSSKRILALRHSAFLFDWTQRLGSESSLNATLASSFVITVPPFFAILLVLRRWTQVRTQQQETIWHQVN